MHEPSYADSILFRLRRTSQNKVEATLSYSGSEVGGCIGTARNAGHRPTRWWTCAPPDNRGFNPQWRNPAAL